MTDYPSGTVTFLFTDIEGSTRRWQDDPAAMAATVERHFALLRQIVARHGGVLYKVIGDAAQVAFNSAPAAIAAALAAQQALLAEPWPASIAPLRVRMALHIGAAEPHDGDYMTPALNRLSRLLAAAHGGQVLLSHAARQLARDALPAGASLRDLGEHRLRDLLEPEHVYQLLHADLPSEFPALDTLDRRGHNLPVQPTPLLGREADIAAVSGLLVAERTRLVTLTGPGGAGKTRLALQVAAETRPAAPVETVFVDLSAVTDAALILPVVAATLGVREEGTQKLRDTLVDALAMRPTLLLLDNLEQVRPPAETGRVIADLLAAVPTLRMLATSRAPLRIRSEYEYPVPPLPVPDPAHLPPLATLAENPAVRLFLERAKAARPAFALTPENAAAIAALCQRLDGLPLAIELAAARIRVLPPADLTRRLGDRLDLLADRNVDRPDRQQTLTATIDWSYHLLQPEEQALFRRLAVFAGGCTLEAAEAIAAAAPAIPLDIVDGLSTLVEQSLLRADELPDETRYRMLETLRSYGRTQLRQSGEEAVARAAHAAVINDAIATGVGGLRGVDGAIWAARLENEHDNLRAALDWAIGEARHDTALALGATAWPFWEIHGHLTEGRARLAQALAGTEKVRSPNRAASLAGASLLARVQGDLDAAAAHGQASLALWRDLGERAGEARALRELGVVADLRGDEAGAAARFAQSLTIFREIGDELGAAAALNSLGVVRYNTGELAEARRLLEESLAISRRVGQRSRLAVPLNNLGVLAIEQGDLAQGRAYLEESLALDREFGTPAGIADTLENLSVVAYLEGDFPRAARLGGESLAMRRDLGDRVSVAFSLEAIAATAAALGCCEAAARLYGAAEAQRAELGSPLPPGETARYQSGVAQARAGLDEATLAAAWAAGRALPWAEAAAEGLALAERLATSSA